MAWRIEFDRSAERELAKLDPVSAKRVLTFRRDRVSPLDDPPMIGTALTGSGLGHLRRYRIGDTRVIVGIADNALRILAVAVGNRRGVYR